MGVRKALVGANIKVVGTDIIPLPEWLKVLVVARMLSLVGLHLLLHALLMHPVALLLSPA